jgi:hypothetical protein
MGGQQLMGLLVLGDQFLMDILVRTLFGQFLFSFPFLVPLVTLGGNLRILLGCAGARVFILVRIVCQHCRCSASIKVLRALSVQQALQVLQWKGVHAKELVEGPLGLLGRVHLVHYSSQIVRAGSE